MEFWIARDKDKSLFLYLNKPILNNDTFTVNWDEPHWWDAQLTNDMFPDVTFENSPQQVELKLVMKKIDYEEDFNNSNLCFTFYFL